MKNFLLSSFLFLLTATQVGAQSVNVTVQSKDGDKHEESIELPESMSYEIDSLLSDWNSRSYIIGNGDCQTKDVNPLFSDSEYIDRLSRIPSIMEMPYNDIVRKFIDVYTGRLRHNTSYMLGAANFYIPIFEEALDVYNIPQELKYLPIIESALQPTAVSRVGASGLWQFMIGTGKYYGLESNSLIDERRDPIKSTWAAARYLKDLYAIYQDWNLVIAAYNCGPGNINKAIRRAGGSKDYWAIYNYLPKETRGYVPAFIAANYVMTYYCDHNICPMENTLPANTDTVQVTKDLHFEQIADICGINVEQIRSLNPQYKRDIVPGNTKSYPLRLPQNYISTFIDSQDTIYAHRANELFTKRKTVSAREDAVSKQYSSRKTTYHKIKNGDTLSTIARKYGVSVSSIKKWNNLRSTRIAAGKRLRICR
ncbi:MAG: transglycosylase SLT domain-containing protein [Bacteroidaceae bacterium]